jgi:urease gamma subunit
LNFSTIPKFSTSPFPALFFSPASLAQVNLNDEESVAAASEQLMEQIRVARQTNEINALAADDKTSDQEAHESQNGVQSNQNEGALDELTLDGADDDENRNKR